MRNPRIFHLIQRAHSALFRAADRYLRTEVGLSTSQQAVLMALMKHDGLPISILATELGLGKSTLTGLADRMSAKGLVRRERSPDDARSFTLHIESAGRQMATSTLSGTRAINSALIEPFSPDERAIIEKFLIHVARNADQIVSAQTLKEQKDEIPS